NLPLPFQDGPGPKKADPSRQPLEDTAQICEVHPGLDGQQDKERGPQRDQHVRPEASRAADDLPLEPQEAPEARREPQAQQELGELSHARQIRKIRIYPRPDLVPQCIHYAPAPSVPAWSPAPGATTGA